ncbi:MAG: hypothetical protein QNJ63_25610 [Calothrix sp. MO_192.B10]|nr:hypothetical protein [Calothrix sp. MO_192.B10]
MDTVTLRLKHILFLTSAVVMLPDTVVSQENNTAPIEEFSKSESSSNPYSVNTPDSISVTIPEPESFQDLSELGGYSQNRETLLVQQTRVRDLASENSNKQPCTPVNIGDVEFTKLVDLTSNKSNQKPCIPTNIGQPEFSSQGLQQQTDVSELEKQQIPPKSDDSTNFPLVAKLDKKPAAIKDKEKSSSDPKYIDPPYIVPNKKVNPLTTKLILNGQSINHLTTGEFVGAVSLGDGRNTSFDINGILKLDGEIEKSVSRENILVRKQTGSYIQLQTVNQKRQISVNTKQPQTLTGIDIQLSLIGSCIEDPDNLCTFTPSLVTDENLIDPTSLQPTRFLSPNQFGDVVTPESFAAIQEPGFQSGANGQEVGVNLSFPNTGSSFGNTQFDRGFITRKETTTNTYSAFYSTVRQVFKANDKKAVVGRTVRGFGFVLNDDNSLLNSSLQLANVLLPNADPQIKSGANPAKKNINTNLFFAVNNVWRPNNSLTIYHAGLGEAKTPQKRIKNINQLSPARYYSIWLGMSPVKKINISGNSRYQIIGDPRITTAGGSEGGADFNGSFISEIDGQRFTNANLENVYSQIYLTGLQRDANLLNSSNFQTVNNYYPHISISGNITDSQDIFRYYGGLITSEKLKAYLGADFTRNTPNGWTYSLGGIAYTNPDRDYYSQVQGSLSKRINLNQKSLLLLSTGFNYAFDGDTKVDGVEISNSVSSLRLGATVRFGSLTLGLVNYFGDILPNSIDNSLLVNLGIRLSNNFQISGYYKPIDESNSSSRYGASATWKLSNNVKSPIVSVSWTNNEYKFGTDGGGNKLNINDNRFTFLLKGLF